ncbi:MAG: hypothetical protein AAFQ68_05550 [Bacteroidota bacterium]
MKTILSFILLLSGTTLFAQSPDKLHFQLNEANNMMVDASLNGRDSLKLMFHLAESEVSLTEAAVARLDSIKLQDGGTANTWGGTHSIKAATNQQLQIGKWQWDSLMIFVDRLSGPGSDGKFGPRLFGDHLIELDFTHQLLILHPQAPDALADYASIPIEMDGNLMFVEVQSRLGDSLLTHRFMLHSGYGGGLLFDDAFAEQHQLGEQLTIIKEQKLKDSFGNVLTTKQAIMPGIGIAGLEMEEVLVGFFEGEIKRQSISVMGMEVLRHFDLIIDPKAATLYLRKG